MAGVSHAMQASPFLQPHHQECVLGQQAEQRRPARPGTIVLTRTLAGV